MALSIGTLSGAAAQRASDLLGNLPPAGELSVATYFPDHPDKQFPAGDVVRVPRYHAAASALGAQFGWRAGRCACGPARRLAAPGVLSFLLPLPPP